MKGICSVMPCAWPFQNGGNVIFLVGFSPVKWTCFGTFLDETLLLSTFKKTQSLRWTF